MKWDYCDDCHKRIPFQWTFPSPKNVPLCPDCQDDRDEEARQEAKSRLSAASASRNIFTQED